MLSTSFQVHKALLAYEWFNDSTQFIISIIVLILMCSLILLLPAYFNRDVF